MKKNRKMNLFGLALTAVLSLSLLASCGTESSTPPAQSAPPSSPPVAENTSNDSAVGSVLLCVNPEIEMSYDDRGNVVELNALNPDGQTVLSGYTGYQGNSCMTVIGELVGRINDNGYFDATIDGHEKNIVLKMARGSVYPSEQFLNELAQAVRTAVEADQIGSRAVPLDQDDYDDVYGEKGYINAQAAQGLLSAQLERDDLQFVEKEYDLDDGEYEVEFVMDGVEYEYEVNAYTGKITEMEMEHPDDDLYGDDRYDDDWDDRYDDDWDDDDGPYDDDWDDDDDDWYDDPTGDDYWDDDDDGPYDDDWDDDDDWYDDPTGDDYWDDDDDDGDDRYDYDWDDRYDDDWDDDDWDDDDWDDDDWDDDDWDDDDWDDDDWDD